jgi:tetratricopeptide (TPR) repeat protein
LARLAFHAAQSGLAEVAANSYLRLAEQAQSRHAYLEAESMYTRALEQMLAVPNAQRLAALRGRALMRYRLSRYEDASKDFELAREIAHHLGELESEVEILLDEATALDWADEYRRSKELVDLAELLARNCESPLLEAKLLMGLGRSCVRFNTHERAAELYGLAAQRAGVLGDPAYETYVISLLHNGYVLASLGRLEESERAFNRVIPLCEQRGDKLHLGAALGNRITLWTCRNDEHRLMADLYRLLQICREMGNGRMEQQAHFYLGLYLRYLGELEDAEKHARRAVEIDGKRLGEAARPESSLLLARVLAAAGNLAGARYILRQIQGRRRGALGRRDQEIELLPAEEVFFSLVDLATREASGEEWEALWTRAVQCLTGQDQIEFWELRGRAAQRQGARDEATRAFEQALAVAHRVPNVMGKRLEAELNLLTPLRPL